eukprot:Hpha_TRINITY_DN11781_c0_g1::TRINITY_DN11781_c0_g1_i1::g.31840::m.31840
MELVSTSPSGGPRKMVHSMREGKIDAGMDWSCSGRSALFGLSPGGSDRDVTRFATPVHERAVLSKSARGCEPSKKKMQLGALTEFPELRQATHLMEHHSHTVFSYRRVAETLPPDLYEEEEPPPAEGVVETRPRPSLADSINKSSEAEGGSEVSSEGAWECPPVRFKPPKPNIIRLTDLHFPLSESVLEQTLPWLTSGTQRGPLESHFSSRLVEVCGDNAHPTEDPDNPPPWKVSESGIYLSNMAGTTDVRRIVSLGIHTVIDMTGEIDTFAEARAKSLRNRGVTVVTFMAEDRAGYRILRNHLLAALSIRLQDMELGGATMVNCAAGLNRSVAVAVALIMVTEGLPLFETIRNLAVARGRRVLSNDSFRRQLVDLARMLGLIDQYPSPSSSVRTSSRSVASSSFI